MVVACCLCDTFASVGVTTAAAASNDACMRIRLAKDVMPPDFVTKDCVHGGACPKMLWSSTHMRLPQLALSNCQPIQRAKSAPNLIHAGLVHMRSMLVVKLETPQFSLCSPQCTKLLVAQIRSRPSLMAIVYTVVVF